jgi:hypothetical protein
MTRLTWRLARPNVLASIALLAAMTLANALAGKAAAEACAVSNGYRFLETYQPLSRFWPFQLIESGIFVGLSIIVLAVAAWWILRRTA